MNTAQQRQPLALKVSKEMWDELSQKNRLALAARHTLTIKPSYAPAPDLDMPIELAPVPRYEVA